MPVVSKTKEYDNVGTKGISDTNKCKCILAI